MTERSNLRRKLVYAVLIALLVFPLSYLGAPLAVERAPGGELTPVGGGSLAVFRDENGLSQGNLGEIDPASETIKLATLGLRGVAVNALWHKANQFKMKEDWGNLTATLEQLSKLQPNYITFWKYQAWNLTYNVSVEFDDYRDRYYYVRRGIEFLKKGETYNKNNPQILWELGWFIGQKIGRADEKIQYRRLFRSDDEFHPEDRPQEERDNWLVGKEWYRKAELAAEDRGIGRKSPIVFYSSAPKNQMNYAEAIESEGRFDRGLPAWRLGGEEWADYGNLPIEHSTGVTLYLNEEESLGKEVDEARTAIVALKPEVTEGFFNAIRASLNDAQREAYDTPLEERTPEQHELALQASRALTPPDKQVVAVLVQWAEENDDPELRVEALRMGEKVAKLADRERKTKNYKQTANFDYWKLRCEFEQSPACLNARKLCYQAKRAMIDDADPLAAKLLYAEGLAKWSEVLDAYPKLLDAEGTTGDDIMDVVKEYAAVLEKIDEEIPDDFPLWDVIQIFDTEADFAQELDDYNQRRTDNQPGSPEGGEAGPASTETPAAESAPQESKPEEATPAEEDAED